MTMNINLLVLTTSLLLLGVNAFDSPFHPSTQRVIDTLFDSIQQSQFQSDQSFDFFKSWHQQKGLFPTAVHINFCGDELKTEARRQLAIPDSNMFVTTFMLYTLLESQRMGTISGDAHMIDLAVEALISYSDGNSPQGSGIYTFWPQVYNSSAGIFYQSPYNLVSLMNEFDTYEDAAIFVAELLKEYGIVTDLKSMGQFIKTMQVVFHIPPDTDDTGCNLALGGVLYELQDDLPNSWRMWSGNNTNVTYTLEQYSRYAYRPYSNQVDQNSIDPRTYYIIRGFLHQWIADGNAPEDLVLPGTWVDAISQQSRYFPYLQMPFNENNIDLSVACNSLFGIATVIKLHGIGIITPDIERMVTSIYKLLAYGINSEIVYSRPDLALLYYPSIYDYSWFVSRVVFFLEEYNQTSPDTFPQLLTNTLETLRSVMMNNGTNQIVSRALEDQQGGFYWQDFLGNDDTLFGKKKEYGEDRFASSALALNALYDTWTFPIPGGPKRVWRQETPPTLKAIIEGGVSYLKDNVMFDSSKTYNAFFSGSMKSMSSFPLFFPSNLCQYFNGTTCNPNAQPGGDTMEIIGAVSGVINETEYQQMLTETWFGSAVPISWTSYNPSAFPYWSSTPLTYGLTILALSKSTVTV
ncbi:hypothetical protein SAMD00019534_008020, partial [Acytostelium subglobosum LB1]|uniref:hypothetical protein n=1 Tax=Acytostelium subglobosum LB1 TaxID=1410327 RepID=UPI000644A95A